MSDILFPCSSSLYNSTNGYRTVIFKSLLYERFKILIFMHFSSPEIFYRLLRDRSNVTRLVHSETEPIADMFRLERSSKNIVLKSNF